MSRNDAVKAQILDLAKKYRKNLEEKIQNRKKEMEEDDLSHHQLYSVLGIDSDKGNQIDVYQNIGRFLYKYSGSFLEEAAVICFQAKFPKAKKVKIPNTISLKPKTFEIDCLVNKIAYEIKWRDATTDGDHITKEHNRVKNIKNAGYTPVRIMFYEPNRGQAIKIQQKLKSIYESVSGEYYSGLNAWEYIYEKTDIDLNSMLKEISEMIDFMEI